MRCVLVRVEGILVCPRPGGSAGAARAFRCLRSGSSFFLFFFLRRVFSIQTDGIRLDRRQISLDWSFILPVLQIVVLSNILDGLVAITCPSRFNLAHLYQQPAICTVSLVAVHLRITSACDRDCRSPGQDPTSDRNPTPLFHHFIINVHHHVLSLQTQDRS